MAITTDAFGNTFAGNFLTGDTWEPNDLLTLMRTALGSNDRANINRASVSISRIDWKTTDDTLPGVIASPAVFDIRNNNTNNFVLTANSRMAFSVNNSTNDAAGVFLFDDGAANVVTFPDDGGLMVPTFSASASFYGIARDDSISFFITEGSSHLFLSQGILQNSGLSFPNNRYGIAVRTSTNNRIRAVIQTASVVNMFTSTAVANYAHNDGSPTTDEVELYLRRQSDSQQLGYVPNVFKFKIDGAATPPAIGNIVNLDMSAATGFYAGQGIRKCIVVGRLGNTSETDLTGDYLLMMVAS